MIDLIIRDKRYMINEMQSDLTTGDVNFTLINDFAQVKPITISCHTNRNITTLYVLQFYIQTERTQVDITKSANASNVTLSSAKFTSRRLFRRNRSNKR
jgi:hypothetical protein